MKIILTITAMHIGMLLFLNASLAQPGPDLKDANNTVQNEITGNIQSKTIVFITGSFVSNACWDEWRTYFESKGFTTLAPPWPGKDADAATLRARHPDTALAAVGLNDVIESYTKIIKALPEKPILIGHSFGGAISQILLNRGLAAACVAIHTAPPKGVLPYEFRFIRSTYKALGLFTSLNKTYLISFKKFQNVFVNGLPLEDQKQAYEAFAIPESKRATRDGLTRVAYVDFKKEHAPLLILAGTEDKLIPAHLCKRVFRKYESKTSITEFVLKERNHFVLGLPTWKEDAEYILNWINNLAIPKSGFDSTTKTN